MIKNIIKHLFATQHVWRSDAKEFSAAVKRFGYGSIQLKTLNGGFNELSELYISMFFRSLALSVIGIFVPVFLLRYGYSLQSILLFFVFFFAARAAMDIVGGYIIARFGPKHTMVVSYVSQIIASLMFLSLPQADWPLILPALFWGAANSLFFVAFHVDFSKIKHTQHGGKELGFVHIMEKFGAALGPVTGGLLAYFLSPRYIFIGAIILLLVGLVPLFKTPEPTRLHQKLDFKTFRIDGLKRDYFSYAALTMENTLTLVLWPLFLALFVLGTNVFLELGVLASLSILASIIATYLVGKLVDTGKGKMLLKFGAITNAAIHVARVFVSTLPAALGIGILNEMVTVAYRLPYHKALYDAADDLPGHRIVYIVSMESLASFSKCILWAILYMASLIFSSRDVMFIGFACAAASSLLILTQKYKTLEYAKNNG